MSALTPQARPHSSVFQGLYCSLLLSTCDPFDQYFYNALLIFCIKSIVVMLEDYCTVCNKIFSFTIAVDLMGIKLENKIS